LRNIEHRGSFDGHNSQIQSHTNLTDSYYMNFHHTSNSVSDMNGVVKEPEKRKREGNSALEIPI